MDFSHCCHADFHGSGAALPFSTHYHKLFESICGRTRMAESHIFEQGAHPAMMSNMKEFISLCEEFFA